MVRYPRGHKEKTREQIVDAAARAFREAGVDGVGVGELMGRVGLTHGGFYAHFESKDALVAEACGRATEESAARLMRMVDAAPPDEALAAYIRGYVSRTHRDDPGGGCLMPALGTEMPRHAPGVRAAFTRQVRATFATLRRLMSGAPASAAPDAVERTDAAGGGAVDTEADERAIALAAGMAGAVMLARAVDDPELSDRILRVCRRRYTDAFANGG